MPCGRGIHALGRPVDRCCTWTEYQLLMLSRGHRVPGARRVCKYCEKPSIYSTSPSEAVRCLLLEEGVGSVLSANGNGGVCPKLRAEGTPAYPSRMRGDGSLRQSNTVWRARTDGLGSHGAGGGCEQLRVTRGWMLWER